MVIQFLHLFVLFVEGLLDHVSDLNLVRQEWLMRGQQRGLEREGLQNWERKVECLKKRVKEEGDERERDRITAH